MLDAAREKKAFKLTLLDFKNIQGPVNGFFIVCSGNSSTQTQAIADEIKRQMLDYFGQKPEHIEGYQRGEWILMDYGYALAHIYLPKVREFYRLEELWGDADTQYWDD